MEEHSETPRWSYSPPGVVPGAVRGYVDADADAPQRLAIQVNPMRAAKG